MTNAEAIRILRNAAWFIAPYLESDTSRERVEKAVGMAIKALEPQEAKNSNESGSTHKALDTISRQAAIERLEHLSACDEPFVEIGTDDETFIGKYEAITEINDLPPAQPASISEAYAKAVFTWLLDYQIKAAELKGRYTPYEVLSWVANDWRKEHE